MMRLEGKQQTWLMKRNQQVTIQQNLMLQIFQVGFVFIK